MRRSSITATAAASTPASCSVSAAARPASFPRSDPSVTRTTTPLPRASSRRSSASSSTASGSRRVRRPGRRSSTSSRPGTTLGGVTQLSSTAPRWSSRGGGKKQRPQALDRPQKRVNSRPAWRGRSPTTWTTPHLRRGSFRRPRRLITSDRCPTGPRWGHIRQRRQSRPQSRDRRRGPLTKRRKPLGASRSPRAAALTHLHSRLRLSARPAITPVCAPLSMTTWPFTMTKSIPTGNCFG